MREEGGFGWERVFGVSVGALNGALLGQGRPGDLAEIWRTIREEDVHRKFSWPVVAFRVGLLGKRGLYDDRPLRATIERHLAGRPFRIPVHVGRVSLASGLYELVGSDRPEAEFLDAIWHSATMPVVWEPVGPWAFVDGGLRNVTPLGDALGFDPTEIAVILASPRAVEAVPPPRNLLQVAIRGLADIAIDEILVNDVREFERINRLVGQAAAQGVALRDDSGRPYRHVSITVIEPPGPLGDTLDFSPALIRERVAAGEAAARRVLERAARSA
ncbi:MAG TPA: patatin-like phospholipase family protein [Anaeromyxobacteraceae bacterium]|nr:patatin-like phospholipase family protein [Anaeromyxobacteraceae bacterium]